MILNAYGTLSHYIDATETVIKKKMHVSAKEQNTVSAF
jgi:hypothetical protein